MLCLSPLLSTTVPLTWNGMKFEMKYYVLKELLTVRTALAAACVGIAVLRANR